MVYGELGGMWHVGNWENCWWEAFFPDDGFFFLLQWLFDRHSRYLGRYVCICSVRGGSGDALFCLCSSVVRPRFVVIRNT